MPSNSPSWTQRTDSAFQNFARRFLSERSERKSKQQEGSLESKSASPTVALSNFEEKYGLKPFAPASSRAQANGSGVNALLMIFAYHSLHAPEGESTFRQAEKQFFGYVAGKRHGQLQRCGRFQDLLSLDVATRQQVATIFREFALGCLSTTQNFANIVLTHLQKEFALPFEQRVMFADVPCVTALFAELTKQAASMADKKQMIQSWLSEKDENGTTGLAQLQQQLKQHGQLDELILTQFASAFGRPVSVLNVRDAQAVPASQPKDNIVLYTVNGRDYGGYLPTAELVAIRQQAGDRKACAKLNQEINGLSRASSQFQQHILTLLNSSITQETVNNFYLKISSVVVDLNRSANQVTQDSKEGLYPLLSHIRKELIGISKALMEAADARANELDNDASGQEEQKQPEQKGNAEQSDGAFKERLRDCQKRLADLNINAPASTIWQAFQEPRMPVPAINQVNVADEKQDKAQPGSPQQVYCFVSAAHQGDGFQARYSISPKQKVHSDEKKVKQTAEHKSCPYGIAIVCRNNQGELLKGDALRKSIQTSFARLYYLIARGADVVLPANAEQLYFSADEEAVNDHQQPYYYQLAADDTEVIEVLTDEIDKLKAFKDSIELAQDNYLAQANTVENLDHRYRLAVDAAVHRGELLTADKPLDLGRDFYHGPTAAEQLQFFDPNNFATLLTEKHAAGAVSLTSVDEKGHKYVTIRQATDGSGTTVERAAEGSRVRFAATKGRGQPAVVHMCILLLLEAANFFSESKFAIDVETKGIDKKELQHAMEKAMIIIGLTGKRQPEFTANGKALRQQTVAATPLNASAPVVSGKLEVKSHDGKLYQQLLNDDKNDIELQDFGLSPPS